MKRRRWRTSFDIFVVIGFVALGVELSLEKDRQTASLPWRARSISFGPDGSPIEDHHLPWLRGTSRIANRVATSLTPFLAASGVGLVIATRPRRWKRHRSGRGAVGVAVTTLLCLAWLAALWIKIEWYPEPNPYKWSNFGYFWNGIAWRTAQASVGAWCLMALLGRWRAGRGWRERLARLVGWGWAAEAGFLAICTAFGP